MSPTSAMSSSLARLLVALSSVAAWQLPPPPAGGRASRSIRMDEERREKLSQLFGAQAADKLAPRTKREAADAQEIAMLQEGIQTLDFGATRLIDVDMAPGPLETSIEPLLEESELLCVRLDMPLGMLLEEITLPPAAGADAAANGTVAVAVAELFDEGSAISGGVRLGDLVRATTAVTMAMSYPAWQLMLGGVGKPSLQKVLFATAGAPFDATLAAITSNSAERQGNGQVVCLVERGGPGDFDRLREAGVSPISPLSRRPSAEGAQPDAG